MPTAQDTTYLIEVMPGETTQDFLSRDVDLLVSQIKENLRLSGLKAKSSVVHRKNRATPYRIPSRASWADPDGCDICAKQNLNEKLNGVQLQQEHDQQQQLHHCHQPEFRSQAHYCQQQQQQRQRQCCHRYNHRHHRHRHRRHHHHHHHHHDDDCSNNDREDDPYEFLQELLREGGLIKEAVKRLQANIDELECLENDQLEEDEEDDDDDEEEDVLEDGMVVNGAKERSKVYRRKPYFYDSEDEPSVYESVEL